jgi:hypothetical protein
MNDLVVTMDDVPGRLATLAETLGQAGINIEGGFSLSIGAASVVHVLVEDAVAARAALEGAGMEVEDDREAIVVYISGEDRPGTLGRHTRKLANAGVNIELACFSTRSRLAFVTSDNAKARAALRE